MCFAEEGALVGQDDDRGADRRFTETCIAAAALTHVTAIVPVFFERLGPVEDWFLVVQSGEFLWRFLEGLGDEPELRSAAPRRLQPLLRRIEERAEPFGPAAHAAVRASELGYKVALGGPDEVSAVLSASLEVTLACDRSGIPPAASARSWLEFELRATAAVAEELARSDSELSDEALFDLRVRSGMVGMEFRNAFQGWVRAMRG